MFRAAAFILLVVAPVPAQEQPILLKPARVFDGRGVAAHEGWVVLVRGERIAATGPAASAARPNTPATTCSPASPRSATSAPKAPATPTSASSRRSRRGSSPARGC